jgi:hypothetical protein
MSAFPGGSVILLGRADNDLFPDARRGAPQLCGLKQRFSNSFFFLLNLCGNIANVDSNPLQLGSQFQRAVLSILALLSFVLH